jgi:hypothetical protein
MRNHFLLGREFLRVTQVLTLQAPRNRRKARPICEAQMTALAQSFHDTGRPHEILDVRRSSRMISV